MKQSLREGIPVKYLDANVFIYAALNVEKQGEGARALLQRVQDGKDECCSSALTFDEIVYVVGKHRNLELGRIAGEAFLELQGLDIIPVDEKLLHDTARLIRIYNLKPRDAIHASSALLRGVQVMVSTDSDFDKVKELKRVGI